MVRGRGERIAALQPVADLEEHQEGGKGDREALDEAHDAVAAALLEEAARKEERQRRHAVAPQEPVEDRRRAEILAGDGRVVGEAGEDDDTDRADDVAQDRQRRAVGDPGGSERRERKRDGQHALVEGEGEPRRERRDGGRGGRAERQANAVDRPASGSSMRRSQPAAPAKAAARSAATTAKEMLRSNAVTRQYATTRTSSGPTVAAPTYQAEVASGSVRPRAIRHREAAAITR